MAKKVVRMTARIKGGKVVGVRQTNKKTGLANKILDKVVGKVGK